MKLKLNISVLILITTLIVFTSCRKIELVTPTEYESVNMTANPKAEIIGMYLLNEGNMGSNKASIDFLDYRTAIYARNIYAEKDPTVVKELGDVGNDIQVYKDRLYAVINCSHKVEVMDAYSCERITHIDIPNCRYIRFDGDYGYVSSYVGPISVDPNAVKGAIFKIDLATNTIVDKVTVGYQPEEMEIINNRLYVANSGGYRAPNYDYTVSVVDLKTMKHLYQIEVGINLHRLKVDKYGKIWVSSRGDYDKVNSNLYVLDKAGGSRYRTVKRMDIPCSNMALKGDSLYLYSVAHDNNTNKNTVTYAIINVKNQEVISRHFISDGSDDTIAIPYGLAIHPITHDIYVTDARNYVSSGQIHCYDITGRRRWSMRTGDIPAHMAFLTLK